MAKEKTGYGVLTVDTIDNSAKLSNVNRIMLHQPKITYKLLEQRMNENHYSSKPKNNLTYKPEMSRIFIWTDGSKTNQGAGIGVFFRENSIYNVSQTLPSTTTSAEAELIAIETALRSGPIGTNVTIFSDNLYAVKLTS